MGFIKSIERPQARANRVQGSLSARQAAFSAERSGLRRTSGSSCGDEREVNTPRINWRASSREGQKNSDDVSGLRTLVGLRQAQETRERLPDVLREVRIVVPARHVCRIF